MVTSIVVSVLGFFGALVPYLFSLLVIVAIVRPLSALALVNKCLGWVGVDIRESKSEWSKIFSKLPKKEKKVEATDENGQPLN
jgi:hypothetical protein